VRISDVHARSDCGAGVSDRFMGGDGRPTCEGVVVQPVEQTARLEPGNASAVVTASPISRWISSAREQSLDSSNTPPGKTPDWIEQNEMQLVDAAASSESYNIDMNANLSIGVPIPAPGAASGSGMSGSGER
jgi:hypothetical protein